MIYLQ
jgi:hypothetical protein